MKKVLLKFEIFHAYVVFNTNLIIKAMCIVDVARVCNNGKYGRICCMQHVAHVAYPCNSCNKNKNACNIGDWKTCEK